MQHGVGERGAKSPVTGEPVAGPETLAEEELAKNRADTPGEAKRRPLLDDYYARAPPIFEEIEAPLLSAGNWGGMGLHTRGNFEGWLARRLQAEVAGGARRHPLHAFLQQLRRELQKRFFGHFLKGEDTGWDKQPRVALNIRHPGEKFVLRAENEWPLARTQWTKYYLQPDGLGLSPAAPRPRPTLSYETTGDGLTFRTPPLTDRASRSPARSRPSSGCRRRPPMPTSSWRCACSTRPARKSPSSAPTIRARRSARLAARLASQARPEAVAAVPALAHARRGMAAQARRAGRARRRNLADLDRGAAGLSARAHGARQGLRSRRHATPRSPNAPYPMKGVGPFLHIDPDDRPARIFAGANTLHFAPGKAPYLLLPVIPEG